MSVKDYDRLEQQVHILVVEGLEKSISDREIGIAAGEIKKTAKTHHCFKYLQQRVANYFVLFGAVPLALMSEFGVNAHNLSRYLK